MFQFYAGRFINERNAHCFVERNQMKNPCTLNENVAGTQFHNGKEKESVNILHFYYLPEIMG